MQATLEAKEKELQRAKSLFHMPAVRTCSHINLHSSVPFRMAVR